MSSTSGVLVEVIGRSGLGPFTWDREELGSIQEWVDGRNTEPPAPADIMRMGILDAVVGNLDRHRGNHLITAAGHLVAIDHGLSFTRDPIGPNGVPSLRSWAMAEMTSGALTNAEQEAVALRLERINIPDLLGGSHLNQAERKALIQRVKVVVEQLHAGTAHKIQLIMKARGH